MRLYLTIGLLFFSIGIFAQNSHKEEEAVTKACLNYLEGFYEGDTTKLISVLTPSLYKLGFWKNKKGEYESEGLMSYREALDYATGVMKTKRFAKPDAPKEVKVLDISNHIASAKVTAWWGIDYMLLSKNDDKWIIEEVLWEGPLDKK